MTTPESPPPLPEPLSDERKALTGNALRRHIAAVRQRMADDAADKEWTVHVVPPLPPEAIV